MWEIYWQQKQIKNIKFEAIEIMDKKHFMELNYKDYALIELKPESLAVRNDLKRFSIKGYICTETTDETTHCFIIVIDEENITYNKEE